MSIRRLGAAGLGLVTAMMGLVVIAGPVSAEAPISCKIQGVRSGYGVFVSPDIASTQIGFVYQYAYQFGCVTTEGVPYNVCGGGTTYYEVVVDGRTGYTPKSCFTETNT